ncbi:MAG: transcription-repair coupling factor [Candidatus Paracaedibacteraceae bacterium]|nr:transcription-repair coupling factor [Candidatus Paracaedibacteraceae bacterium]
MKIVNIQGGVTASYTPFFCIDYLIRQKESIVLLVPRDERIYSVVDQLRAIAPEYTVFAFPGWDCLPYDRVSPSSDVTHARLSALYSLLNVNKLFILVTSVSGIGQQLPPPSMVRAHNQKLSIGDTISREALLALFTENGCHRVEAVYEIGEFSVRGSLIDVFAPGSDAPVRLDFFGDELESIKRFDPITQKTNPNDELVEFAIRAAHEVLLTPLNVTEFRQRYRALFGGSRTFPADDILYQHVSDGRRHPGVEHWLPLFYEQTSTLFDFLPKSIQLIFDDGVDASIQHRLEAIDDYYKARLNPPFGEATPYHPIKPELFYWQSSDWDQIKAKRPIVQLLPFKTNELALNIKMAPSFKHERDQSVASLFNALGTYFNQNAHRNRIITCASVGARDRLLHLFDEHGMHNIIPTDEFPLDVVIGAKRINEVIIVIAPFDTGFESDTCVLLTEQDILGEKIHRQKIVKRKSDAFFQEISQLGTHDLIVHRDHGIGRYMGLETITVDSCAHDCLMLIYADGDKLFLPVENIELINRYGDADSLTSLDRLGSGAWQLRKAKVKKRIQIVADYLIRLAAERSLHKAVSLEQTGSEFDDFCARFPYVETDDQLKAIMDVLEDLASGKPMDRLVCGDVGFGKTEVALRAAFIAVMNGMQVAVIVPTTLLCRQHYSNFQKRFQGFPFRVAQLSRLVKPSDAKLVHADLAEGKVDIIIATHAILSEKTKFSDLGLVIVDEEQHFGVKQKEKLKELRSDVHVLTLTATPIPRTLQLSLAGVRDLSLITTPPVDRLAVRTFVMPKDTLVIREAIMREFNRGGQIFYVTPRLEDLSDLKEELQTLVPEVKFAVASGQLSATELEDVMTAFYDHKFDVLISTNIIESGIDVPSANTMIIHRCDLFGLSQLYQLRGRVGRSKTQGYAYLTYSPKQELSSNAMKRLQVLQSLDTLGAGFTLASHDLDIRGAGNIVGEEQSGHIREVGVELYQTLLHEAIMMHRAMEANTLDGKALELDVHDWTPQINLGVPVLIPETYVTDLGLRLNLYRRIANLTTRVEIDAFAAELIDRFGKLPVEAANLLDVVELKSLCRQAHIEKLEAGPKGLLITFRNNTFKEPVKLLQYLQMPQIAKAGMIKIRPDQKLFFSREFEHPENRRKGVRQIIRNLVSLCE